MRWKLSHRISRVCAGRVSSRLIPEFKPRGNALFFIHGLQRSSTPGVCLRCSNCVRGHCRFQANGARRGISDRILSSRKRPGTCRLRCSTAPGLPQAADNGCPEFFGGVAYDNAERCPKISTAFRAPTTGADPALCFARSPPAALDAFKIFDFATHDAKLPKLGPTLRRYQWQLVEFGRFIAVSG